MVTTTNVKELRPLNFGLRCLTHPITCAAISREIASYDPTDAALVSDFTRKTAGADAVFDRFVSLYKEVIDQHRNQYRRNPTAEDRAAAAYLRGLVPRFHKLDASQDELKMVSNSRSWRLFSRYTEIRDLFIFTMCGRLARLLRRQTR